MCASALDNIPPITHTEKHTRPPCSLTSKPFVSARILLQEVQFWGFLFYLSEFSELNRLMWGLRDGKLPRPLALAAAKSALIGSSPFCLISASGRIVSSLCWHGKRKKGISKHLQPREGEAGRKNSSRVQGWDETRPFFWFVFHIICVKTLLRCSHILENISWYLHWHLSFILPSTEFIISSLIIQSLMVFFQIILYTLRLPARHRILYTSYIAISGTIKALVR